MLRGVNGFLMGWAIVSICAALMFFSTWLTGKVFADMPAALVWGMCLFTVFISGWGLADTLNHGREV